MKIAYFTDSFLPSVSGIVTSIVTTTEELAKRGHKILIIAPKKNNFTKNVFRNKNVTVQYIGSIPALLGPNLRASSPLSPKMLKAIFEFNPDVVHFHTPFLTAIGAIMLGRLRNIPILSTFHSYFMSSEYLNSVGIKDKKGQITRYLWEYVKKFYEYCDAIVAPTAVVQKDILKHIGKKTSYIIPTSLNENLVKTVPPDAVKNLKKRYKLKKQVVLFVGRLSTEKNINLLMRSFALILKTSPDMSLFIVGGGPLKQKLSSLRRRLKLGEHVVFAGEVQQKDLLGRGYFQAADLFATASTSETQGISIVEAMYFGLPIIGVSKKGVRELVQSVGLSSKPTVEALARNMKRILTDPVLARELSKKSLKEFALKYKTDKIISDYEKVYKDLITSYGRSAV